MMKTRHVQESAAKDQSTKGTEAPWMRCLAPPDLTAVPPVTTTLQPARPRRQSGGSPARRLGGFRTVSLRRYQAEFLAPRPSSRLNNRSAPPACHPDSRPPSPPPEV